MSDRFSCIAHIPVREIVNRIARYYRKCYCAGILLSRQMLRLTLPNLNKVSNMIASSYMKRTLEQDVINEIRPFEKDKNKGAQMTSELERLLDIAQTEVAKLEAEKPQWISVDDRLPEKNQKVLTFYKGTEWDNPPQDITVFSFCRNLADDPKWWVVNEILSTKRNITHWMPLPEPPKESA